MENIDSIVIEQLKALRTELGEMRSLMQGEIRDVNARISSIDAGQGFGI